MKVDRLLSIIMVLLEREKVSATKLAELFEVTPRTIYRDIETIELAGIPIVTYPGVNGGISIMEQYKIDKKLFTTTDVTTLLMGLGSISPTLDNKALVNTLAKVQSLIPEQEFQDIQLKSNQIAIDLTMWSGNQNLQTNLETAKIALNESKYLQFDYSDKHGSKSQRTVEPYQLVLKEGSWYLQAYCIERGDFRVFKLFRITALQMLDTTFIPRSFAAPSLNQGWMDKKIGTIKVWLDESLRERVVERYGEEVIVSADKGQLIVDLPFAYDDYSYNILLGFGDKCECLEPQSVRVELTKRIQAMADIYK